MKRWMTAWLVGLSLLLAGPAGAQQDPQALVRETTNRVLAELEARKDEIRQNPRLVYELVREIVLPHFDFELMSRFVLARNWRTATPEQRERFVEEFRELLIRTYGTSLAEYSGQEVRYLPFRDVKEKRATVRTEIVQPEGPAIPLDYQLYRTGEGWKVFDVVIDGVSLVQNYRGEFAAQIQREGLDTLIERLEARNEGARTG